MLDSLSTVGKIKVPVPARISIVVLCAVFLISVLSAATAPDLYLGKSTMKAVLGKALSEERTASETEDALERVYHLGRAEGLLDSIGDGVASQEETLKIKRALARLDKRLSHAFEE